MVLGIADPDLDVDYIPRDGIALLLLEARKCRCRCSGADDGCHIVAGAGCPLLLRNPLSQLDHGGCVFRDRALGVFGFLYDHELLQATFLLFVPFSVVPLRLWLARKLEGAEVTYETYYGLITRYRRPV